MRKGASLIVFVSLVASQTTGADTLRLCSWQTVSRDFVRADASQSHFLAPAGQLMTYIQGRVESVTFAALQAPAAAAQAPSTRPAQVTVLAGTPILVRMVSSLNTSHNRSGDLFTATLETNLAVDGVVVARRNATVHGKVTKSEQARRLTGKSELQLALINIVINGSAHPISTGDFQQVGSSEGVNTVKKTAAGAGLGAAIGAISGNAGKGAAIGAVSGVGVSMVKKGEPIRVPSETLLEFRLSTSVILPTAQ